MYKNQESNFPSSFAFDYDQHMIDHFEVMGDILDEYFQKGFLKGIIFDLGCGTGACLLTLSHLLYETEGKNKVIGIDGSSEMLGLAKEKTEQFLNLMRKKQIGSETEIKFYQQNMTQLNRVVEREGKPDVIIVSYCFHWLNRQGIVEEVVKGIYRNLKEGGYFISFEECPLNISIKKEVIDFIRDANEEMNLEELYQLVKRVGFAKNSEALIYNIDTKRRLKLGNFLPKHEMYGKVFQKPVKSLINKKRKGDVFR